ncbi:MAG TPA: amidohydrolase family protein, partial [Rubrobacteraceae bacterium]|nr:amidohydrolase family protein [Rubrobacteraceae bacterium]
GDMLGAASLGLHVLQMSGQSEIDEMLNLVTTRAARTLGIEDRYGIEEGKPASLVIFDAKTPFDTLRLNPARLHVIKDGRTVAATEPARTTLRREGGRSETVTFSSDVTEERP